MEGEIRDQFNRTHPTVEQQRPLWDFKEKFIEEAYPNSVTVLICQKNSKALTQITIESLQRWYPDIRFLIVDDNSNDDSILYLKYKELTTPNLKVWWRNDGEYIGHGDQLHLAMSMIETEYVFILDSDVLFDRGGFLEPMLKRFEENKKLYAIGTLQYASYINNGGEPFAPEDATPYAAPNCSLYHVATYFDLPKFLTDGAPCILNMKGAKDANLDVEYFPTDQYCSHLSGGSWATPKTAWMHDHEVLLRSFLTIITNPTAQLNIEMIDNDFDVVITSKSEPMEYTFTDRPNPHPFFVDMRLFGIRFNVHGEYVVDISDRHEVKFQSDFLTEIKKMVIEKNIPDEIFFDGFRVIKRTVWQRNVR